MSALRVIINETQAKLARELGIDVETVYQIPNDKAAILQAVAAQWNGPKSETDDEPPRTPRGCKRFHVPFDADQFAAGLKRDSLLGRMAQHIAHSSAGHDITRSRIAFMCLEQTGADMPNWLPSKLVARGVIIPCD